MPPSLLRKNKWRIFIMNVEGLKKRKELMENNLRQLRERIAQDTQNSLRMEGAIIDLNELITEIEKKEKEEKEVVKEKVKK